MAKAYRCSLEVRGYELDSFGHVNHANYLNYLEHARWSMLRQEGITLEKFQEWKIWPVIASIEIQYRRPAFMGETLEIQTQIIENSRTSFVIRQVISRAGELITEATVHSVMVNEKGRPTAVNEHVARLWADAQGAAL